MEFNLAGKTALITGSSRGIGLAIAKGLFDEGCKVAFNSRHHEDLTKVVENFPGSIAVVGDVTKPSEAKRIVSEVCHIFGKLDILVCNVGSGKSVIPGEETLDEWQQVFELNLWSATNTVAAAYNALVDSKGVVVCISSICGLEVIPRAPVTYSAAKAALNAYVRGIARPLGKKGIRINAIAPGNILFEGSIWSGKNREKIEEIQAMLEQNVVLNRLGTPKEISNLVIYLASDVASFATGGIWTLDGGQVHS
jgi:3-oxoacyl-[acyl-carrier protein] reductase